MVTAADGIVARRDKAMRLVQDVDDGLSNEEKVALVSHFMTNAVEADTYLSLVNDDVRQGWIRKLIGLD